MTIRGVNEEGYFNATLLVELFNKRTTDYLRLDSTKTLVKNLEISDPSKPVVKKYRGGQGTWLRNDMLSSLETWLNKVPKPSSQWKEDIFFQWLTQRIEEKQLALTLNFQYPVLSYRIDCYIPELNLCIEFDARPSRQQAIITHLKCQFFSINKAYIGRDFTRLTSLLETQAKRVTRFINIFD